MARTEPKAPRHTAQSRHPDRALWTDRPDRGSVAPGPSGGTVDAGDSKSPGLWPCEFESHLGHHNLSPISQGCTRALAFSGNVGGRHTARRTACLPLPRQTGHAAPHESAHSEESRRASRRSRAAGERGSKSRAGAPARDCRPVGRRAAAGWLRAAPPAHGSAPEGRPGQGASRDDAPCRATPTSERRVRPRHSGVCGSGGTPPKRRSRAWSARRAREAGPQCVSGASVRWIIVDDGPERPAMRAARPAQQAPAASDRPT